ncbi:MAG: hypothetical protein JW888_05840 [Pirellulales bacterium]|nr:hypothetical protein [Pirellulales bacterium]
MRGSLPNLVLLVSISSPPPIHLSLTEWRVLRLTIAGCNRRQIAMLLDQTMKTIEQCQADLKRKAAVATLGGLARWVRRNGLCPCDDRLSPIEQARLDRFERPKS